MSRKCSVCLHPDVSVLNVALEALNDSSSRWTLTKIAEQYQINRSALSRHYLNHVLKTPPIPRFAHRHLVSRVARIEKLVDEIKVMLGA